MHPFPSQLPVTLWFMLWAIAGCASREVPARYPDTSAASPRASAAKRSPAALALKSDPPLPDADTKGWPGLTPTGNNAAPSAHEGHRHAP